ncbi:MAG: ATP-binding cassette domain-containing protein [Pseudobutyrivibrio sp.]|nr:ATP-binding cassette domain-containing protein [Pseudobutyrivibrio sp.]
MINAKLLQLLKEYRIYMILTVLWQWLGEVAILILAFSIARTLAGVATSLYIGLALFAIFLRVVSDRLYLIAASAAEDASKKALQEKLIEKSIRFGSTYKSKAPADKLTGLINEDADILSGYYASLGKLLNGILAPVTSFILLSRFSSTLAGILLLEAMTIVILIFIFYKNKSLSAYWEVILDCLSYLATAIGMGFVIRTFFFHNLDSIGLILFLFLVAEFFVPVRKMAPFVSVAITAKAAWDRISTFLAQKEPEERNIMLPAGPLDIFIAGLCYTQKGNDILEDVGLSVSPGDTIGILDPTGVKKNALIAILRKQYVGYKGTVRIASKDVKFVNSDSLLKAITVVSFDSYIFSGTVRENLQMGHKKLTDKKLLSALKIMGLLEAFIGKGGLDFNLVAGGINLTIGQRRRFLTARALLKNSAIYIFDDIDENIDEESLGIIYNVIGRMSREMNKTVIVMSKKPDYLKQLKEVKKL